MNLATASLAAALAAVAVTGTNAGADTRDARHMAELEARVKAIETGVINCLVASDTTFTERATWERHRPLYRFHVVLYNDTPGHCPKVN
jgi:hypothetical protein